MAHRSLSSGDRLLRQRILTSPPGRSRPLFNSPHQCSAYISGTVYTPAMSRIAIKICRSEEHTSEPQSLMRISYAVFCLKNTKNKYNMYKETDQSSIPDEKTIHP